MTDEFVKHVIEIVAKTQHIPAEQITIDTTFAELGVDSLDGINLIFALENEFNLSIPDDAARSITDVRGLCEGVSLLVESAGQPGGAPCEAVR